MARSKARRRQRQNQGRRAGSLLQRIADAMGRNSYQRAREEAKALYQQEATPEHRRYLVEATIGRALQLQKAGQNVEAAQMLMTIAEEAPDTSGQLVPYIDALLLTGEWRTAERLIRQASDPDLQAQLAALRIDHAVLCGEADAPNRPPSLTPHAQCVLQALTDWQQGHDAAANEAVSALPEDSPWRDWRALIQGLSAFYHDPSAALAHWRQLDPERAPAAIAAPFWAQLDKDFLADHPERATVTARGKQLYDAPWIAALEGVQEALLQSDIALALRQARQVTNKLPAALQEVKTRLSDLLYWQIARVGDEDDIARFKRTFGAPPDDPSLNRLQAYIDEQDALFLEDAQTAWAKYEQDLQRDDIIQPASDRDLARSLIWFHMGEIAQRESPPLPSGLDALRTKPDDFEIDAIQCLRRSVELAPQHLAAHEVLLALLFLRGDQAETARAAQDLLVHFPDHDKALTILATDAYRQGRWEEALTLQTRALRARPHDAMLQARLLTYQLTVARLRAQQGQVDEARDMLTSCLQRAAAADQSNILCRMAAVAFKAGQPKEGEHLFEQACEVGEIRLVTVFEMLIESCRMPVDDKWIKKMDREFRRGLKAKVHGPSVVAMIKILESFAVLGHQYDELEEHRDLVLQYLKRSRQVRFSQEEFVTLCNSLPQLEAGDLTLNIVKRALRSYPRQAAFHVAFAAYYLDQPSEVWPLEEVDDALHRAEYLVDDDPNQKELAAKISAMLTVVHAAMAEHEGPGFFNPFDDDDDMFGRGRGRPGPSIFDLFDKLADLIGDDLDDDDDDDFNPFAPPRRRKNARRRRR